MQRPVGVDLQVVIVSGRRCQSGPAEENAGRELDRKAISNSISVFVESS